MYLENSPFTVSAGRLKSLDYIVYADKYESIVLEQIPTSQKVLFVAEQDLQKVAADLPVNSRRQLQAKVFSKKTPACLEPDKILLPLDAVDREDLAAMVVGIDHFIAQKASSQWLLDIVAIINDEFSRVANRLKDPVTSLCNLHGFKHYLARSSVDEHFHIVLAESLPPAKSVKDAFAHLSGTAKLLEQFNRQMLPLFHLGQSVFAYIVSGRDKEFIKSFCHAFTTFVRNNGGKRIHIGFSSFTRQRHQAKSAERIAAIIVDEAWKAMQQAGKRGPYAFCDYELLVNPDIFPIKPIPKSTMGKLAYRWKDLAQFTMVYLKPDAQEPRFFDEFIGDYLKNEVFVNGIDGYLLVRAGRGATDTRKWVSSLIRKIRKERGDNCSLSAGICSYPFEGYRKTEIVNNCQKALLHASFFGAGSSVIFDSLSLNVSGDAYFAESDLSGAVREYRRGLELAENEVNLLNSLGVAYALMNRTVDALAAFSRVLETEPNNFMALFNKGLGEKALGNYSAAVDSFTKALEAFNESDAEEVAVIGDLRFQLGVCLHHIGRDKDCISVLKEWHRAEKDRPGSEKCYRYIGISYYHLGNLKQAAQWLQRGLKMNQFDAESLSILGTIYLKTKEGDDIALKLCEKSVEIDPASPRYRLRYGRALAACAEYEAAQETFVFCTRFKKYRAESWLEIALLNFTQRKYGECGRYLKKILAARDVDESVLKNTRSLQKKVDVKT